MHISQSRLFMYLKCGEQYRRRYPEKEIMPPGIAFIRGKSVHKGIELNNRFKLKNKKDITKKELIKITDSEFSKIIKGEGIYLTKEEKIQRKTIIGKGRDDTTKLTGLYSEDVAPLIIPKEIELGFEFPCEKHKITGRIDIIDVQDALRDTKTASRRKNQKEVDASDQLTFYALAHEYLFGKPPKKIIMDTLVCTKVAKYDPIITKRSHDDITILIRRIYAAFDGMKKGVYLPTNPTNWWCDPKWCGYFETCKFRNP